MPHREQLANVRDKEVVLGIRPEHLHATARAPAGSPSMNMTIDVVEHMGDHQYVYLKTPQHSTAIMKAPGTVDVRAGIEIAVHIDTTHAHIFADRSDHAANITLPSGFQRQQD
jgi:ABC-type sugar transport system ATPase subunit